MYKQDLRNKLSEIEDTARGMRRHGDAYSDQFDMLTLIARLAQIVREEIVK